MLLQCRYLVAILLVCSLSGSVAAVARLRPSYEASSTLVLLVPPEQSPINNPFLGIDSLRVLSNVVAPIMTSPTVVEQLVAQGANRDFVVERDTRGNTPTLRVASRHPDPAAAQRTVALVSNRVVNEVERLQEASGAPEPTWIRAAPLTSPNEPEFLPSSRARALFGLTLASLILTLGITLAVHGLWRRRTRAVTVLPLLPDAPWLSLVGDNDRAPLTSRSQVSNGQTLSDDPRRRRRPFDGVSGLTVYVVLLLGLPSRLVFKPLGAAGTPATLWGLAMLLWWLSWRFSAGPPIKPQPVRLGVQILGVAALITYAGAFFRSIVGAEVFAADRGIISLAAWSGIALLAADGIASHSQFRRLLERVVTGGAFLGALGVLQFFTAIDVRSWYRIPGLSVNGALVLVQVGSRDGFSRVAGTADHPIEFSVILAMLLPLALHLAFHADPSRRRGAWLRAAVIGVAVPLSVSRTGILGVIVGFAVVFVSWPGRRRLHALLLAPFLALPLRLLAPGLLGSIKGLFLRINGDSSFTGRTEDYGLVVKHFFQSPFIGRGWGTFLPDRYILLDNQYLGTLVEAGLLGFLALILIFVLGIGAARGARRRSIDAEGRELGQAFAASIAVAMISFATFDAFSFSMASGTLFLLLGCAGALWRLTLPDASVRTPAPTGPLCHS